jgi:hypothetical protein
MAVSRNAMLAGGATLVVVLVIVLFVASHSANAAARPAPVGVNGMSGAAQGLPAAAYSEAEAAAAYAAGNPAAGLYVPYAGAPADTVTPVGNTTRGLL